MDRRALLTAAVASLPVLPVSGCIAQSPGAPSQSEPPENESADQRSTAGDADDPTNDTDDDSATDTDDGPAHEPSSITDGRGPARGQRDADVETTAVEDDETVEYLAEDDAVRYVAGWRHTNQEEIERGEPPEREPFYETTPFEDWARTQCLTAAARAAAEYANDRLDTDEIGSGVTSTVDGKSLAAVVSVTTVLDRDGDVVSETDVEFDALVAATPSFVEATYRLDDREYELEALIFARYRVLRQE